MLYFNFLSRFPVEDLSMVFLQSDRKMTWKDIFVWNVVR